MASISSHHTSAPPATPAQLDRIAQLSECLNDAELHGVHYAVAIACGYTVTLTGHDGEPHVFADMDAWAGVGRRGYSDAEASALLTALQAVVAAPRVEVRS